MDEVLWIVWKVDGFEPMVSGPYEEVRSGANVWGIGTSESWAQGRVESSPLERVDDDDPNL